ncbi:uncharacterized protein LOC133037055 [Cannabis sativa]|uniref:uncharacterized protein LOC133037055 n=1 Tax=Cannabis sativa TaxID=3483 RepID=UPI0029C9EAE8|nr:uncharacterized protein LOC133037055 [Cannabis sativa]
MTIFPEACLHHKGFFGSDHRALLFDSQGKSSQSSHRSSKRFLFENVWLTNPNWSKTLVSFWTNHGNNSSALTNAVATQSACGNNLNNWNHKLGFHFKQQISTLEKELDQVKSRPNWDANTVQRIKTVQSHLDILLLKKQTYWKQRAKI